MVIPSSCQDSGFSPPQREGPNIVEPITANTRILLFLQHKKDRSAEWEPTYFSDSFFWVQVRAADSPSLKLCSFMIRCRLFFKAALLSEPFGTRRLPISHDIRI